MKIDLTQISSFFVSVSAAWAAIKLFYKKYEPMIQPMVEESEKAALDGVITADERKAIVMAGVSAAEKEGKIKLNWLSRFIISRLVDKLAQKLPDFKVKVNDVLPDDYNKPTMQ